MKQLLTWVVIALLLFGTACEDSPVQPSEGSLKVLFIGNSYTYYNQGVDYVLLQMLVANDQGGIFITDRLAEGGFTLEDHEASSALMDKLDDEVWDYVVLQEQSTRPISDPMAFYDGARAIDSQVTAIGAQTCFYMTWARSNDPGMIIPLESNYTSIATELSAKLAPVGKAWEYSLAAHPEITLHQGDNSHPTNAGTYLTACIFYIVLYGENPVGNEFEYTGISGTERQDLQQTAWEFMLDY